MLNKRTKRKKTEKILPWEYTDGHTYSAGGGEGLPCLAYSVRATLRGTGLWDLQT